MLFLLLFLLALFFLLLLVLLVGIGVPVLIFCLALVLQQALLGDLALPVGPLALHELDEEDVSDDSGHSH